MTIAETTLAIEDLNLDEHTLLAAQTAGRALVDQLLAERRRLLSEVRKARSLQDSLVCNLSEEDHPRSLLGSALRA